ncbi:MAG TPA: DUF1287 domain-containing protein [Hyphomicrobium sp.]|nr:DUF1287 domain-containing protein [Hyphomicrobium sp.]
MPVRVHQLSHEPVPLDGVLDNAQKKLAGLARASSALVQRTRAGVTSFAHRLADYDVRPTLRRLRADIRSLALPYSHDEREALALLFLPFLLVASAMVVHQSVRTLQSLLVAVSAPETELSPVRPGSVSAPLVLGPAPIVRETTPDLATLAAVSGIPPEQQVARSAGVPLVPVRLGQPIKAPATSDLQQRPVRMTELAPAQSQLTLSRAARTDLVMLAPSPVPPGSIRPAGPDLIDAYEADDEGNLILPGICSIENGTQSVAKTPIPIDPSSSAEEFGLRLAAAAETQVANFVIYNDAYRTIPFPMGDVNPLFGVCTDVVIRAYRALGIDLQPLVHEARTGSGDTSIDHRRTEVLRRFFAKEGESLPVTSFPEDYRPGDIVTYHRPQNRRSQAHIAMVSSVIAPSGRPMIVHNRAWGPQLEDALFVNEITGHYRYRGPTSTRNARQDGAPVTTRPGRRPAGASSTVVPTSWGREPNGASGVSGK